MSKLLSSVLDKISEDNNSYRMELSDLNKVIDERTTTLVGDVVTLSNYTIDFSSLVVNSKEKLSDPISRLIESYVIKDLRSVESVNEQFIDKINDKIDEANKTSKTDKDSFIQNLDSLLNDKYLDIIKIKRTDFLDANGVNGDIENYVNDFVSYLKTISSLDDKKLDDVISSYKNNLYNEVVGTLSRISDLYLRNFVDEVRNALNSVLDFNDVEDNSYAKNDTFKPYIPEIPEVDMVSEIQVPDVPEIPEVPTIPKAPEVSDVIMNEDLTTKSSDTYYENDMSKADEVSFDEATSDVVGEVEPMEVPKIMPNDVSEEKKENEPKKTYDVEEILKIAKSPVVTMTSNPQELSDEYLKVSPIESIQENDALDSEFDEREIVEEMIRRLTERLNLIKERQEKYDAEEHKLHEDEAFVNDLIQSSNAKREELDKFEEELNNKENEIIKKQEELEKKINNVLPFADAVMKNSEEEA